MSNCKYISKSEIIHEHRKHEKDTGSCEVQVSLLTARISHLTDHLRTHKKDFSSRRGLIALTNKRRKLLRYLRKHSLERYNNLIQSLELKK